MVSYVIIFAQVSNLYLFVEFNEKNVLFFLSFIFGENWKYVVILSFSGPILFIIDGQSVF